MSFSKLFIEMSLVDGIAYVSQGKDIKHYINEQHVSTASGSALFVAQQDNLQCVCCSLKADKWKAIQTSPHQPPVLNLYGTNAEGNEIIFTRDHIIPKVFGGNDYLENLRIMCGKCNEMRGCELDQETLDFYHANIDKLISTNRIITSLKKLNSKLQSKTYNTKDAKKVLSNFNYLFEYLKQKDSLDEQFQSFYDKILILNVMLQKNIDDETVRVST